MNYIDSLLNKITMYRLTLYYLIFLLAVAVVFSAVGILSYNPIDIVIQSLLAVISCYISNKIFAAIFGASTNTESALITALILALIVPVKFPVNAAFMVLACGFAMGSKYFLTIEKTHVFNPAAAGVAMVALLSPEHTATWWVGTEAMLIPTLLGGYLLIRRIRREDLVLTFLAAYLLIIAIFSFFHNGSLSAVLTSLTNSFTHSALLFFALIMLTEPLTTPGTKVLQRYYSLVVAVLYSTPQIRLTSFTLTPEMALCVGNFFSHIVSPKIRLNLPLRKRLRLSDDTLGFIFDRKKDFKFQPGQYMEWTLPHNQTDSRGNRRYFSLASSPTEDNLMIIVKIPNHASSYKTALVNLPEQKPIIASQISGDFTLPKDFKKPLAFVAGGVGIAPFRSMIKYLLDKNLLADIVLLYSVRETGDVLFSDIFKQTEKLGVKSVVTLTDKDKVPANWSGETGYITKEMIQKRIPDFKSRTFYVSGPQLMVESFEDMAKKDLKLPSSQLVTDYFPGYADKK